MRRAMNHAVDVDELIKQVLKGQATRMCGPLAPANVDYAPVECYKYDPARAQALFKEAGVDPAKLALTLDTPSGRYPLDKDVSLAIAAQLQRLGHQDQRGRERVGHAPRQDQEPQHRRPVLPRLGARPARPGHDAAAVPGRPDLRVLRQQQGDRRQDRPGADASWTPRPAPTPTPICRRSCTTRRPGCSSGSSTTSTAWRRPVEWTPRADEKVWMYDAKVVARMHAITVFTNAFLIDCTGADPIEGAAVVVEDDRIKDDRRRRARSGALPGRVTTLDLKGKTLMPGLTDAHVHICAVTENITDQHRYYPPSYSRPGRMQRAEECLHAGIHDRARRRRRRLRLPHGARGRHLIRAAPARVRPLHLADRRPRRQAAPLGVDRPDRLLRRAWSASSPTAPTRCAGRAREHPPRRRPDQDHGLRRRHVALRRARHHAVHGGRDARRRRGSAGGRQVRAQPRLLRHRRAQTPSRPACARSSTATSSASPRPRPSRTPTRSWCRRWSPTRPSTAKASATASAITRSPRRST